MRIVSLLSSATEIVYLLGLEDSLVGISHECDFPPEALDRPRVSRIRFDPTGLASAEVDAAVRTSMEEYGSVYEVDEDLLAELGPDLVLTQAICEVCAVPTGSVMDAVRSLTLAPRVVSLDAHTIHDIFGTVEEVARAAGCMERGYEAIAALESRLDRVAEAVEKRPKPGVLLLEWMDPPFLPGHWVPEMIERAGGVCLAGRAGDRSIEARWDELAGIDPDILLVEPCGYDRDAAQRDATQFRKELIRIAPRAIETGRAWVLDSAYFSRSGPRVVRGIEALAVLMHPDVLPGYSTDGIASPCGWNPGAGFARWAAEPAPE